MPYNFRRIWSWFVDNVPDFLIDQESIAVYRMFGDDPEHTYLNTQSIPKTLFGSSIKSGKRLEMQTTEDVFDALVLLMQGIVEETKSDAVITIEECVNERVYGYRVRIDQPITKEQIDEWTSPF